MMFLLELLLRLRQAACHPFLVLLCDRRERKELKSKWKWKDYMVVVEEHFNNVVKKLKKNDLAGLRKEFKPLLTSVR
jgi:hypothetical protein